MLALSDAATTGLFALGVAIVGAVVSVIGILVTQDTRRQNRQTQGGVSELSMAWETMRQQLAAAERRVEALEQREQDCLDAVQVGLQRIAVLEERLGIRREG